MAPATRSGGTRCRSKFDGWSANDFEKAGFRAVPSAIVRRSAYIAPGVVLMPSFVNLGAYVDSGTMVDTWAIGRLLRADRQERASFRRRRHRRRARADAGRTRPSSRTIASSAPVRKWSRAASCAKARCSAWASSSAQSTKIVDRATGEVLLWRGAAQFGRRRRHAARQAAPRRRPAVPSLYCAVIVKRVDEQTAAKTSINELLQGLKAIARVYPAHLAVLRPVGPPRPVALFSRRAALGHRPGVSALSLHAGPGGQPLRPDAGHACFLGVLRRPVVQRGACGKTPARLVPARASSPFRCSSRCSRSSPSWALPAAWRLRAEPLWRGTNAPDGVR